MASIGLPPDGEHLSSLLQSNSPSPPRPRSIDFKSMDNENVEELTSFAASSTESSTSDTGHSMSLSSTSHFLPSFPLPSSLSLTDSPPLPPISKNPATSNQSKHLKSNRGFTIDYSAPSDVTNRVIPLSELPTRPKSFNGDLSRPVGVNSVSPGQKGLDAADEALSSSSQQGTLFIDASHHNSPPTSSTSRSSLRHSLRGKSQQQRKSIDLGSNMMQASLRRLRRSSSLWTTGDRSSCINDTSDQHIHNLRAESQLSDQQKLVALRRARKIAQVFGSEAPTDMIHGNGYLHLHSTQPRDSLSTVVSTDLPPSIGIIRRRSNSDSSAFLLATNQGSSTSLDRLKTLSDMVSDFEETSSSFCPSSSFGERRRRAAKLTHFFGVNYQDISQLITQKLLPPTPQNTSSGTDGNPEVEVDVKVVGRRFWGLSDGGTKTADVADVIGKLRGLRAG